MDEKNEKKVNPWMISTLILIGIAIGFGVSQIPALKQSSQATTIKDGSSEEGTLRSLPTRTLTEDQTIKLSDDDPFIGDQNAPITLVEFSDFQCPYCRRFVLQTLPLIEENYIKTGKVKLVYRDYLIEGHDQAPYAALASECAEDQSKWRELHDELFNGQQEWSGNANAESIIDGYAKKIGLDSSVYGTCMKEKKHADEIKKDLLDAISAGVTGTPGFFVNGKEIEGAMPYEEVFKPIFDAELAGKKWELQADPRGSLNVRVF